MRAIWYIILFIWQLPQNIVGLCFLLFCKFAKIKVDRKNGVYVIDKFWAGGVSLGEFIFIKSSCFEPDTVKHECGHRIQSHILGPFYLIIVGIPSACLCMAAAHSYKLSKNYYKYYPENWANKLGGVDRDIDV